MAGEGEQVPEVRASGKSGALFLAVREANETEL